MTQKMLPPQAENPASRILFYFSREELTRITRQVTRTFDLNNPVGSVYSSLNKFRIFIVMQLYIYLIKDANALLIYYLTIIFKKVIYK